MSIKDIKGFPKNVQEAKLILKEAFEIDSRPSEDGLPDKYKKDKEGLIKLRRILEAMHLYAVHKVYFEGAGKAHSEFSLRYNRAKIVFNTGHLERDSDFEVFYISLDDLFNK